jgi:hypothetical protein
MTPSETHPADPELRRLARWLPPSVFLAGMGAIFLLYRWLDSADTGASLDAMLLAFAGLAVLVATAGFTLGWMLWREAAVIVVEDRYPASDMRTLREVPVLRGAPARRRASWMRSAAVAAAGFGLLLIIWALWSIRGLQ